MHVAYLEVGVCPYLQNGPHTFFSEVSFWNKNYELEQNEICVELNDNVVYHVHNKHIQEAFYYHFEKFDQLH